MGKKSIRTKKFIKKHPNCCFCGGESVTETIDHIPPRSLFLGKKYPKEFEFPACGSCNNKTSNEEDAARLISIFQGTAYSSNINDDFISNLSTYTKAANFLSMKFTELRYTDEGNIVLGIDPKTTESINTLATKIALALYYKNH